MSAPAKVPSSNINFPWLRVIKRSFKNKFFWSEPTVDIASLTRNRAPGPFLARNAKFMLILLTWKPSAMMPEKSFPLSKTAPTSPGSRLPKGLIALKRWVAHVAPASTASTAWLKEQSVCPKEIMAPAFDNLVICSGDTASGAIVNIKLGTLFAKLSSSRQSNSFIGLIKSSLWAPLRARAKCGPSRCSPTNPLICWSKASIIAKVACLFNSGLSEISVGIIEVLPSFACASQIVFKFSSDGLSLNKMPPPPFTCKSTKPGVMSPPAKTICSVSGSIFSSAIISTTLLFFIIKAEFKCLLKPSKIVAPTKDFFLVMVKSKP